MLVEVYLTVESCTEMVKVHVSHDNEGVGERMLAGAVRASLGAGAGH